MNLTTRFANPAQFSRLAQILMAHRWLWCRDGLRRRPLSGFVRLAARLSARRDCTNYVCACSRAWIGMALYMAMAVAAGIGLVARHALADIFCRAAAPVGAVLVGICLITGSLWGKPTWGAWWVWDARLTSVLILFLLYCGYITLRASFDDQERAAKPGRSCC